MATCERSGCSKPASMQCPTCAKMKLLPAYFCSQECFKQAWKTHKAKHETKDLTQQITDLMRQRGMNMSEGRRKLHPGKVSPYRPVPSHIPRPDYADEGKPIGELKARESTAIPVYTTKQIETMRKVCRLGREVLDIAHRAVKPGVTTDEIDRIVHEACLERDCYPSPLNYYNFPKSCCTSINEVICHGIPDDTELLDGDILNVDITVYKHGMHGDLNETFLVGKPSPVALKLTKCAYDCMNEAIAAVKPGMMYRDVGNIISARAQQDDFSVVRSYVGHGIGTLFHTTPNIPHYAKNRAVGVMKPGHIFTIEPMINEGVWKDHTWSDMWTAVTADGKLSAQFEHTMLVTDTGVEVLTSRLADSPPLGF